MAKFKNASANVLTQSLQLCKKAFVITFGFALAVNLCMLITPLYSLQVLDRVISSRNLETLLMLTIVMAGIYVAHTLLQIARSFTLIKISEWLDNKLTPILFTQSIANAVIRTSVGGSQNLRDLETLKTFLTSTGINTLFDAPWAIIYLIVVFVIHPYLGYLTLIGGIVLFLFAMLNAYATNTKLSEATESNMRSLNQAEISLRNAEVIEAMGMTSYIVENWGVANSKKLETQSVASYRNGIILNIARFLRSILQMLVTGIGAYLALKTPPELTVGGMIACSIIVGRALAPIDSAIETWKQITGAKKAYERLNAAFERGSMRQEAMSLPAPTGKLNVENLYFAPPSATPQAASKYSLRGVNFALNAGEILAVIGPSAAGKSSLAKLIVGVWKPLSGVVRLDDADVYSWKRSEFGQYVGYLPQDVELFSGSIKENIGRMNNSASPEEIVEAAKIAGAHEMILHLPNGYETDIGIGGSSLSAGQRQRIGLARAFYGKPKLVVLDEPNANLDEAGELALARALHAAKEQSITTIIISHRPSILASVDKILILQEGAVAAFGNRDEILARFARANAATAGQISQQNGA